MPGAVLSPGYIEMKKQCVSDLKLFTGLKEKGRKHITACIHVNLQLPFVLL